MIRAKMLIMTMFVSLSCKLILGCYNIAPFVSVHMCNTCFVKTLKHTNTCVFTKKESMAFRLIFKKKTTKQNKKQKKWDFTTALLKSNKKSGMNIFSRKPHDKNLYQKIMLTDIVD